MSGENEGSPFLGKKSVYSRVPEEVPLTDLTTDEASHSLTRVRVMYRKRWPMIVCLVVVLLAGLLVLSVCIGVYAFPAGDTAGENITQEICANPPLLLISLDGFRASYLARNLTPNLQSIIDNGVRSTYMRSSFPTLTFPNHYSIVTGLYPESHGIVNNNFYDTRLKEKFSLSSKNASDSKWWEGEPVWVTAIKNKLKAGVYFWPGSEAEIKGIRPNYYFTYNISTPFNRRVDTILKWLDYSNNERPQFLAMYFNEPDNTGHKFGPDSAKLNSSLGNVDKVIGRLWEGLKQRNISDCVNVMILSDHGMSPTNTSKIVYAGELLPPNLKNLSYPSYGPVMNIDISGGEDIVEEVYQSFVENGTDLSDPFRVFHTSNLPLRLHTGHYNKHRYGPVYLIADYDSYLCKGVSSLNPCKPHLGNHGYDNLEKTLQAIFIGHGPAFKKNYTAEPFENIQLYSLMCGLLNITSASNNGTVGSLRHILDPQVAKRLPPAKAPGGSPGVTDTCPFPKDNSTFVSRSICAACVCDENCSMNHSAILESNSNNFNLTQTQEVQYQQKHFPWGVPPGGRGQGACLLSQHDFVHVYSNVLHIPLLVGYTLTGEVVDTPVCLRRDPRLTPANSANCSLYNTTDDTTLWDFYEGGMEDEGGGKEGTEAMLKRLLLSEDTMLTPISWVLTTNTTTAGDHLATGVLSATAPLTQSFVTNVWNPIRSALSDWLRAYQTLNVVVGSVLDADRDGLRDSDSTYPRIEGVAVPSHVFVVVTRCDSSGKTLGSCDVGGLEVLGLLFQHPLETGDYTDSRRVLRYGLTPLRDIERVTGLNFFPNLSAEEQNLLELRLLNEIWPTTSI